MAERFPMLGAAFCLFEKGDQVLLSRRIGTGYHPGSYGLPSGHVEDEFPSECAKREAMEEVGLEVEELEPIGVVFNTSTGQPFYTNFFFKVTKWSGELTNKEPDRCDDLRWFEWNSLPPNMTPEVKLALENYKQSKYYSEI